MLIRNLLQDTVGDIRIRKLLETSQTSIRPRLAVRHNKKGNITDHISQPRRPAGPVLHQTERNPFDRLNSHL